jgi:RimJ/RimL family protein N-acetyltransferase
MEDAVIDAASYSATETLRDGRPLEIRALRPEDQADLLAAVGRLGTESLYRRFFAVKRHFSEREIASSVNVDFVTHVALIAVVRNDAREGIVGGGRYVVTEAGKAELAFAIVDQYQGQGIGTVLLRHLIVIARAGGLQELVADVLAYNRAMIKVFERSGLPVTTRRESDVVHVALRLA